MIFLYVEKNKIPVKIIEYIKKNKLDCKPQHYIPNIIKALKGVSARLLMLEYKDELKKKLWGGHLWNPSYFISTVSENTEEQIRIYIKSQKER